MFCKPIIDIFYISLLSEYNIYLAKMSISTKVLLGNWMSSQIIMLTVVQCYLFEKLTNSALFNKI